MGMETAQIKDQYLQWKEAQNTGYSEGSMLHPKTDVKVTLFNFSFREVKWRKNDNQAHP